MATRYVRVWNNSAMTGDSGRVSEVATEGTASASGIVQFGRISNNSEMLARTRRRPDGDLRPRAQTKPQSSAI